MKKITSANAAAPKKFIIKKKNRRGFASGSLKALARRPELKWNYHTTTRSPLTASTPQVLSCVVIDNSVGSNGKIGNKVTLKSIRYRIDFNSTGKVVNYPTLPSGTEIVRILVIWDKQWNNAGSFVLTNYFENIASSGIPPNDIWSYLNEDKHARFQVLRDKYVNIDVRNNMFYNGLSTGTVQTFQESVSHIEEDYIKCEIPVQYLPNSTGALTDISTSNVFVLVFSVNDVFDQTSIMTAVRYTDD